MASCSSSTSTATHHSVSSLSSSTTTLHSVSIPSTSTTTLHSVSIPSCSTTTQHLIDPQSAFHEIASTFACYSTNKNKVCCNVFINHRGPDAKHRLASTIYHTLDLIGLRPFLDAEELKPGVLIPTTIQEAMTTASLHIAIFSPSYAESPWCLAELSFMLKTQTKIVPIFYYVQPSDLRWIAQGKGIYVDAFSQHEKQGRYSPDKIEEWKRALHDVSYMSGHVIYDNEDEGRVLKSIVNEALKIKTRVPLVVAKHVIRSGEYIGAVGNFFDDADKPAEQHLCRKLVRIHASNALKWLLR